MNTLVDWDRLNKIEARIEGGWRIIDDMRWLINHVKHTLEEKDKENETK